MSTQDMEEPRCGVPAWCDISTNLPRMRREIRSSSLIERSCSGVATAVLMQASLIGVIEMDNRVNRFARPHFRDGIVDVRQRRAMRYETIGLKQACLEHAKDSRDVLSRLAFTTVRTAQSFAKMKLERV